MDRVHKLIMEAQQGDKCAFDTVIRENIGLVWSIVKRFFGRCDTDDLFQLGALGLVKAVKKFDFNYDVKFSTYAVPMIMGEIKRFLRDDGIIKVSRSIKENSYKISKAREYLISQYNREPTLDEVVEYTKIDKESVILALYATREVDSIDRAIDVEGNREITLSDVIADDENISEKTVNNILLNQAIERLDKREQSLVKMRYMKEMTQKDIASVMGISQVQVSRLEKKILFKMREYMTG